MPRMSNADKLTIVRDLITAAGGEITHNELISQLEAQGNARLALDLVNLAQAGDLVSQVKSRLNDTPVLIYRLPAAPEAAQTAPATVGGE